MKSSVFPSLRIYTVKFIIILSIFPLSVFSLDFTKHTVTDSFGGVELVAIDMDNDNDIDLVGSGYWMQNDGNQNFSLNFIFTDTGKGIWDFYVIDLDDDSDIDFLASTFWMSDSGDSNCLYWYENDGSQDFTSHRISEPFFMVDIIFGNPIFGIYTSDIDKDGDKDFFAAKTYTAQDTGFIKWYENNGSEVFTEHLIEGNYWDYEFIAPSDYDRDGDTDIVISYTSTSTDELRLFENDGNGVFTFVDYLPSSINLSTTAMIVADVNLDSFPDIIIGTNNKGLSWYKNNGDKSFNKYSIPSNPVRGIINAVFAIDIDSDNDIDIIYESEDNTYDYLTVRENNGNQQFTNFYGIDNHVPNVNFITSTDLDKDGDMDVVVATDSRINWYENLLITPIKYQFSKLPEHFKISSIGPNPIRNNFKIEYTLKQRENIAIEIYSLDGKKVKQLVYGLKSAGKYSVNWDIQSEGVSPGSYIMRMQVGEGEFSKKLVVLR